MMPTPDEIEVQWNRIRNVRMFLCGGTNHDITKSGISCEAMIEALAWVLGKSDVTPSDIMENMEIDK